MKLFRIFILLGLLHTGFRAQAQEIPVWKLEDLKSAIANADQPTILNFWATFCKPCIEEMPHFQELAKKYEQQGIRLVFVSLDGKDIYPDKIRSFMKKRKITAPVTFLDETNADIFCPAVDPSWSGSIPATLFINNKTGYRKFVEDPLSKEELEKEIKQLVN